MLIILIAISLSMDAFSLSLAYGTLGLKKKDICVLSFIVGIFHFIMPLLGEFVGSKLFHILPIKAGIIVFIILLLIGIQMIIESFKKNSEPHIMKLKELLIFGFAVSIDSFSVGIGLDVLYSNTLICSINFSAFSFAFTYLGLVLGNKINVLIGKKATLIGGIVLIIIGFIYLFN